MGHHGGLYIQADGLTARLHICGPLPSITVRVIEHALEALHIGEIMTRTLAPMTIGMLLRPGVTAMARMHVLGGRPLGCGGRGRILGGRGAGGAPARWSFLS